MSEALRIVQVNASERGGGAEAVALGLHERYRARGHTATLLVGRGPATQPGVRRFPADPVTAALHIAAGGTRLVERARGIETFSYPAAERALRLVDDADIVHLHNLHGGYFDLRLLAPLSERVPVILTLHDAWLLSGHCAHSLGCERWRTGCGACPDLSIYPAVARDATAFNWRRKADIFRHSTLHIAAPSRWLAERVRASMLAPGVADLRVIPNGVDLATFTPGDRAAARRELKLPEAGAIALIVGSAEADNPFKDTATAIAAVLRAADLMQRAATLVIVGDTAPGEVQGRTRIVRRAYENDRRRLALYYRAADIYVHAARADTFPSAILEAMACATPVVATETGGIPEQVRSRHAAGADAPTGITVPPGSSDAMAAAIAELLSDPDLRQQLGDNAAGIARRDYAVDAQCDAYLQWYQSLVRAGAAR